MDSPLIFAFDNEEQALYGGAVDTAFDTEFDTPVVETQSRVSTTQPYPPWETNWKYFEI